MYDECFHRERQPDRRKLLSVLRDMGLRFDNTLIIADALDECENIADVLDVLEEMTVREI
jgi:pentose-5-phosphate-3-epimerase